MTPQDMVRQFHEVYGCAINSQAAEVIHARLSLIDEEFGELVDELVDFDEMDGDGMGQVQSDVDYLKVAKELADLAYVVYGTAVALGIDLDKAIALVHESNMSKLGPDGKPILREDGRVLKGPDYFEPDMSSCIVEVS